MTTLRNTIEAKNAFGVMDGSKGFGHDVDTNGASLFASWGVTGGS
jgi:hypothetical protein